MELYQNFKCKCGCDTLKLDSKLVVVLDKIERAHNVSLQILSGYRCPAHNKAVGGVDNSTHTQGLACDFTCPQLDTVAMSLFGHGGGFKHYKDKHFIHIDVGPKRRW